MFIELQGVILGEGKEEKNKKKKWRRGRKRKYQWVTLQSKII